MAKKKSKGDSKLHDAAAKLGSAGGKKGGPARAAKLTAEERSNIARLGGLAHESKQGVNGKSKGKKKKSD